MGDVFLGGEVGWVVALMSGWDGARLGRGLCVSSVVRGVRGSL